MTDYPNEKRVQRQAALAYVLAAGLAIWLALTGESRVLGITVPIAVTGGAAVVGLALGLLAAQRRHMGTALAAAAFLVIAVAPNGALAPSLLDYALGILFGALLLAATELVHMTVRYERAHRAVETGTVPVEHVNRVTDEALKTLAARIGVAAASVAGAVLIAHGLAAFGPRVWREALETTAPLGFAVWGLVLLAAASIYILVRGARFGRASDDPTNNLEIAPDVAE